MKIYSPNKRYSGVSANVIFVNGVGETENPYLIEWFQSHGYTVEEADQEEVTQEETEQKETKRKSPKTKEKEGE